MNDLKPIYREDIPEKLLTIIREAVEMNKKDGVPEDFCVQLSVGIGRDACPVYTTGREDNQSGHRVGRRFLAFTMPDGTYRELDLFDRIQ